MVGSCTNSSLMVDSCWSSWYGDISLTSIAYVLFFIFFILICLSFSLNSWVEMLDIKKKPKKKTKGKLEHPHTPSFIVVTLIKMFIIYILIVDGMGKSGLFAFYHIIPLSMFGIVMHIKQWNKYLSLV